MHLMLSPDDACLVHDKERARMKQQVRALAPSSRQGPPCAVLFQELSYFQAALFVFLPSKHLRPRHEQRRKRPSLTALKCLSSSSRELCAVAIRT